MVVNNHSGTVTLGKNGNELKYPSSLTSNWVASSIGSSSSETYNNTLSANDTNSYDFEGYISLFRIWNVARTATEIDDNKSTFITSATDLVAYSDQDRIYYEPDGATDISSFEALNTQFTTIPNTDAINLQNTRDRTIEFRFKATNMNVRQVLYEEGGATNAITAFIEGGRFYFGAYRLNASVAADRRFFRSGVGDVVFNQWYHVAITLEDTASPDLTLKWYLDGVEQDSQDGLQINTHSGDINIARTGGNILYPNDLVTGWGASSIGSSSSETFNNPTTGDANTNNFSGDIDLFRIWNVARTPSEIDTNKNTFLDSGTSLVAYQSGTQINYQPNGGTTISAVENANGVFTWDGSTDSVWTETTNWIGDTPPEATRKQIVVIPEGTNDPILTSEISVGFLTVNTDVELVIQSGATLNVFYGLYNNGTITVEDGGSLIYHNCNSAITGSGSFNVERTTPTYNSNDFYSYWSSPVISSDSNIDTVFSDAELIYSFNAAVEDSDWVLYGTADFSPGVGYAIQNEGLGGQLRTFEGKINEGNVTVSVYDTSNLEGEGSDEIEWSTSGDNLVGNPFPAALNWDVVVQDSINTNIDGTIYFWDQTVATNGENEVADYKSYNVTGGGTPGVTGNIGAGQAFFVKTEGNGTISFKPTHLVAGSNTQFYKSTRKNKISNKNKQGRSWFSIHHNNKLNTILIGFLKGATENYDRLYDGLYDTSQKEMAFYSLLPNSDIKTAIQGLPELSEQEVKIDLGFYLDKIGEYKIDINQEYINQEYQIYLKDKTLNTLTNLRAQSYIFNIDEIGENNNRFQVIYKKSSALNIDDVKNDKNSNAFSVYVDDAKELTVKAIEGNKTYSKIKVSDIQGREVLHFKKYEPKNVAKLSSGIYVVTIISSDNFSYSKKILITN